MLPARDRDLPPHLKSALEKLSFEHPSGISLAQLDTPMMKQFASVKEEVPDALVFFRMGDFFELFGADAIIAADVCGLTLTSRDKSSENPVPMAGVPVVAYRQALKKCVNAGYKVAVCDQVEDPKQAKTIVRREIVRIATPAVPGDLSEEDEAADFGCYLASIHEGNKGWTLAFVDVSTGEFRYTGAISYELLQQELLTLKPREILVAPDRLAELSSRLRSTFHRLPRLSAMESWIFRSEKDAHLLFQEFFSPRDFNRFGLASTENGLQTVTFILAYLKSTQRDVLRHLKSIQPYTLSHHLLLDDATKTHLDFFQTAAGERKGSLYWFINRCVTGCGSRHLARALNYPMKHPEDIAGRQARVAEFVSRPELEDAVAKALRECADIDRLLARAAQNALDSKGMAWLRQTLAQVPRIVALLGEAGVGSALETFAQSTDLTEGIVPLQGLLARALEDDPAPLVSKAGQGGRIFRAGYSPELDEVTSIESNFDALIGELEAKERVESQIQNLKIGFNRVFGYYFEVSKGKLNQVPAHFVRKQTLTGGERYITADLKELEDRALNAQERRAALEKDLFEGLRQEILQVAAQLSRAALFLAEVDVNRCLAFLAIKHGWVRPQLSQSNVTALRHSVHPILEQLQPAGERFVANSIVVGEIPEEWKQELDSWDVPWVLEQDPRVLLITGPNMAGKSTIMRQLALAQVLFQMGSFVPAAAAIMGPCDQIFTRIGASDNALKNQSTFMVEMLESAHMLKLATPRSLLIMDEIGRGTSTFDGLSIAWAILEDPHDRVKARGLFSTHYHELIEVTETRPAIVPMRMEVIERDLPDGMGREIVFSRRFLVGAAGKSYGIHVAALAGHDESLVRRASEILDELTQQRLHSEQRGTKPDLAPSQAPSAATRHVSDDLAGQGIEENRLSAVLERLQEIEPNHLTPMQALQVLFELTHILQDGKPLTSQSKGSGIEKHLSDDVRSKGQSKGRARAARDPLPPGMSLFEI